MRTETRILSAAMYELARTVQSDDGIANSAIRQAALRLDEQTLEIVGLRDALTECRCWIDETYENRSVFKEPPKINIFECA